MNKEQAYDWLAPKLTDSERRALDIIASASQTGYAPCYKQCESAAFNIEIRRLKSAMINAAAYLARELHDDDMTDIQADRLHNNVVMKLKSAALDGA